MNGRKPLKGMYITNKAFGFLDLGLEHPRGFRFGMVDIDTNDDGIVDDNVKQIVQSTLYDVALSEGANKILDEDGSVFHINQCLDFTGAKAATDDSISVFNKGQKIMLVTEYEEDNGDITVVGEDALTSLGFEQLHYLVDNGYLV